MEGHVREAVAEMPRHGIVHLAKYQMRVCW